MTILGIDHVQLAMPVGAEDTAREFYHGVLGWQRPRSLPTWRSGADAGSSAGTHISIWG